MQIICALVLQQCRYLANNCNSLSCDVFCTVQVIPRSIAMWVYLNLVSSGGQ